MYIVSGVESLKVPNQGGDGAFLGSDVILDGDVIPSFIQLPNLHLRDWFEEDGLEVVVLEYEPSPLPAQSRYTVMV